MNSISSAFNTRTLRVMVAISAIILLNVAVFAAVSSLSSPQITYAQGDDQEPDDKLQPIDFYPSPNQNGAMAFSIRDPWNKTDLTFYFHNCPTRIDCSAAHGAVRNAFQAWADVSALTFTEVTDLSQADIEVTFTSDDPEGVLGTPGDVLAYNYFPRFGGDMFIDDSEPWTIGDLSAWDLTLTAIHEIGHGIGIAHSEYKDAIMYPMAGHATSIGPDDIQAVQELYGPPTTASVPDNTTTTDPVSTETLGSVDVVAGQEQEIKGTVTDTNPLNIWTLNVPANSTVTITMYGTSGDLDPYIGLLTEDLSEVLIENDNWYFNDARVIYSFDTAGTYSLVATRFGFVEGGTSGTYTLTIESSTDTQETVDVAPPAPQTIAWRITNLAGTELCSIFFSTSTSDTWGPDQIANEAALQDGFYYEWDLAPDTYDVQVWDCFNNKLEQYSINATRSVNLVVYQNKIEVLALEDPTDLNANIDTPETETYIWRVSNYSTAELCGIYFSPSTSDTWGDNQLTSGTLSPNFYFQWELDADTYDVRVEDCNGGFLEYIGVNLFFDTEVAVFNNAIVPRGLQ